MEIYKTTNIINGKVYIGQSKYQNPNYYGSGKILLKAIKKHGKQNFKKEILCENITSFELLDELEKHYIQLYASYIKGYNVALGGRGNKPEQNKNISLSNQNRLHTKESKVKMSIAHMGKICTDTHKSNVSKSLIGNQRALGLKHSDETKKKISDTTKRLNENPEFKKILSEKSHNRKEVILIDIINNTEITFKSLVATAKYLNIKWSKYLTKVLKEDRTYRNQYKLKNLK